MGFEERSLKMTFVNKIGCYWRALSRLSGSVKLLIATGAPVMDTMNDGFTAITVAVVKEHKPVVEVLLKAGADIFAEPERSFFASLLKGVPYCPFASMLKREWYDIIDNHFMHSILSDHIVFLYYLSCISTFS